MSDDNKEVEEPKAPERRAVHIWIKPKAGVDPETLHKKIITTVLSQPDYKMKWDDACKIKDGRIYSNFTINEEADFHEEVMDEIEMMYDEVAGQDIVFQTVME